MKITNYLLALIFSINTLTTVAQSGINFSNNSLEEAKIRAEKENKLIFIDAYADWCGPCKWMTANTFTDSDVGEYFEANFISIQIDMESEIGIEFDTEYYVDAYPTLLFLNSKGEVVKRYSGALDPIEFLGLGNRVVDPTSAISYQLKKQIDKGDQNDELLAEYLMACIEELEEPSENIVEMHLSNLEEKSKKDSQFISDYLIESNDYGKDVNNKMVVHYFNELNIENLTEEEPFTIFYYYQQDLKAPSTIYFMENFNVISETWGEYASEKFGLFIINASENLKIGSVNKSDIYTFIKQFSEHNDIDYNELKIMVDDIIGT